MSSEAGNEAGPWLIQVPLWEVRAMPQKTGTSILLPFKQTKGHHWTQLLVCYYRLWLLPTTQRDAAITTITWVLSTYSAGSQVCLCFFPFYLLFVHPNTGCEMCELSGTTRKGKGIKEVLVLWWPSKVNMDVCASVKIIRTQVIISGEGE